MNIDAAEIYNRVISGFNRASPLICNAPNQFYYTTVWMLDDKHDERVQHDNINIKEIEAEMFLIIFLSGNSFETSPFSSILHSLRYSSTKYQYSTKGIILEQEIADTF